MICPKCGEYLENDEVLLEESNGSMEYGYCDNCNVHVNENCEIVKL